ncbi:MAG: hypothetical protein LBB78_03820 [Spirochaetaceae bacterium]|jgi:hypothetical protein|nr:hypothetical protein [Spirochaetaceae bacterium]
MMSHDYIPARDAEFDIFFTNLVEYVDQKTGGNVPEWTHIPPPALTALRDARNAWEAAYIPTTRPHTPVETEAKNDAKQAAKQVLRPFVNQYLRYLPVTNEDRTAMGIRNKDTIPTPIPPPEAQAEADLTFPGVHLVEVANIRAVKGGTAPDLRSDYGVRIYYGFSGSATEKYRFRLAGEPKSGGDLPYSVFTRRKKERFDFDGESGNTVYFCLRYENPRGQTGPFGPMLSAVIP